MNIQIPVSWLRDYLKTDVAAKTVANYLTASGPSVERIEKHGEDFIFDVEITTNRPDAFSVYGLAREANAILATNGQKSQLVPPKGLNTKLDPDKSHSLPLDVQVKDKSLCQRFAAIVIDNVQIKPSPAIIKNRLETCGIRAINNIVDISNYIMLELGQPMHTFDYDKIRGAKMTLRESQARESIRTLDGQNRKLPKGTIVIEDSERLIDLCGIMGGENSGVSTRTKRVVLFVQSYDPIRIRKTTQALAFRTDASARFEKGIDLEGIIPALSRAVYLAKQTAGAKVVSELIDIYQKAEKPKPIILNISKLNSYIGVEIPEEKAGKTLEFLGFKVSSTSQTITATPPTWRFQDMEIEEDLIEEIARIYGYHNLPSTLPKGEVPKTEESILANVIELKNALKYLGLTEIISYSIISKEFLKLTQLEEKDAVELQNPLSTDWQFMRNTLVPSLTNVVAQNQNLKSNIKLFEVAKTYLRVTNDIPTQDVHIAFALQNSNFLEIKGLVENLFEILKREPKFQKAGGKNPLSENSQFATIKIGDKIVGGLGILKREVADYFDIAGDTFVAEINLSTVYNLQSTVHTYHPMPKFPPVIEDMSVIFDEKTPVAEIVSEAKKIGSPLVKNVEIIDIFRNGKIGKGKKSITLRLSYQKSDSTPEQEEVTRYREIIAREISRIFQAQVRK
ncbi:MAG: phenylalanine--tRNA ligase subunit beta [Candidatus Curtissbacteria bacterium]|nr:phenylalanine--tRNA ligase subunit beta [Candidatus Curtissbacteria bacterium]